MIGYDKLSLNHQILLDLPFREGTGIITHDVAKPHHIASLAGHAPVWGEVALSGLGILEFNGTSQYLEIPAADTQDLDFTGDFTMATWIYPVYTSFPMCIIGRNKTNDCGWLMYLLIAVGLGNTLSLRSNQTGSRTGAWARGFPDSEWQLVGFSVESATNSAICYKDGAPLVTAIDGGILDPVACIATRRLLIGRQEPPVDDFYKGKMWRPRAWPRKLSATDWMQIFQYERHWFGV